MATSATPYGARPIGTLSASGSFTAKVRHLPIASGYGTAIFNGDFVKIVADGDIELDNGTTALTTCGIFVGCSYTPSTTNQKTFNTQWPASTVASDAMAYVIDDPFVVFQMQADEAMNTTDRGLNVALPTYAAGSTAIGKSVGKIDGSTAATTNTLPLRILDFVDGPDSLAPVGTTASDAFPDVIVKFNAASSGSASNHQYLNATGL
jgi:hypothetical protein